MNLKNIAVTVAMFATFALWILVIVGDLGNQMDNHLETHNTTKVVQETCNEHGCLIPPLVIERP